MLGGPCEKCGLPQIERAASCRDTLGDCPYRKVHAPGSDPLFTDAPRRKAASPYPSFFATLMPVLRRVAEEHGYALGLHGSMARDLDLIACPWVDDAADGEQLVEAIIEACGGVLVRRAENDPGRDPTKKPHGRLAWSIHLGGGPYIDLSVMPRLA